MEGSKTVRKVRVQLKLFHFSFEGVYGEQESSLLCKRAIRIFKILDKTSPLALKKVGVFLSTKIATGITNTAITEASAVLTREIMSIFRP